MERKAHKRTRHLNIMLLLVVIGAAAVAIAAWDPLARAAQYRSHAAHRGVATGDIAEALCRHSAVDRLADLGPHVDAWLDLDERQAAAWDDVERAIVTGLTGVRDACDAASRGGETKTARDRLARAERLAAAGTDALRGIRPAFDEFYESLDAAQRERLDAAIAQGPGRRWR